MFSRTQQVHLEALGYVLYQPRDVVASAATSMTVESADFWQTTLGRNIARFAINGDTSPLRITTATSGAQFKRALWQQMKALRQGK